MSDPSDIPRRKPARAEPAQQDRPGRGDKKLPDARTEATSKTSSTDARQQKEQSDAALDNVREGYD
jgi:hypothetical protein